VATGTQAFDDRIVPHAATVKKTRRDKKAGSKTVALHSDDGVRFGVTAKPNDSDAIIDYLNAENIEAVIPSRRNRLVQRPLDKHRYKSRNLVEHFFCRIKQFRRIATRYDKLAQRFSSFIALAAAVIWLA
jgi:hypothetical protein